MSWFHAKQSQFTAHYLEVSFHKKREAAFENKGEVTSWYISIAKNDFYQQSDFILVKESGSKDSLQSVHGDWATGPWE